MTHTKTFLKPSHELDTEQYHQTEYSISSQQHESLSISTVHHQLFLPAMTCGRSHMEVWHSQHSPQYSLQHLSAWLSM